MLLLELCPKAATPSQHNFCCGNYSSLLNLLCEEESVKTLEKDINFFNS